MAKQSLLESFLPKQFSHEITAFSPMSETDFQAEVRVDVKCEEEAKRWKEEFEKLSGTNFIVKETFPNVQRYQFHKSFICHRSSKNKLNSQILIGNQ